MIHDARAGAVSVHFNRFKRKVPAVDFHHAVMVNVVFSGIGFIGIRVRLHTRQIHLFPFVVFVVVQIGAAAARNNVRGVVPLAGFGIVRRVGSAALVIVRVPAENNRHVVGLNERHNFLAQMGLPVVVAARPALGVGRFVEKHKNPPGVLFGLCQIVFKPLVLLAPGRNAVSQRAVGFVRV